MDARDLTVKLLAARAAGKTVCPSEVARALAPADAHSGPEAWREVMPTVHAAVDQLVAEGRIRLTWKGKTLPRRSGPYRIGRG